MQLNSMLYFSKSPPTRVVWIEITNDRYYYNTDDVTTHTGGVDWNYANKLEFMTKSQVTTHTGGVDWNTTHAELVHKHIYVTTHTGGVDWNLIIIQRCG